MSDNEQFDEIATAELSRVSAKTARALYNAYLAEGFSPEQALALVQTALAAASS
jgi:hypothetical protein